MLHTIDSTNIQKVDEQADGIILQKQWIVRFGEGERDAGRMLKRDASRYASVSLQEGGAPSMVVVPIDEHITGFMQVATVARSGLFRCVDVARPKPVEAFMCYRSRGPKSAGKTGEGVHSRLGCGEMSL